MKLTKKIIQSIRVEVATKGCKGCIFDTKDRVSCMEYRIFTKKKGFIECTDGFIYIKGKRV